MAVDRALVIDILPTSEQPSGTAWAARMLVVGSVAGFFMYVIASPYPSKPIPPIPPLPHIPIHDYPNRPLSNLFIYHLEAM